MEKELALCCYLSGEWAFLRVPVEYRAGRVPTAAKGHSTSSLPSHGVFAGTENHARSTLTDGFGRRGYQRTCLTCWQTHRGDSTYRTSFQNSPLSLSWDKLSQKTPALTTPYVSQKCKERDDKRDDNMYKDIVIHQLVVKAKPLYEGEQARN